MPRLDGHGVAVLGRRGHAVTAAKQLHLARLEFLTRLQLVEDRDPRSEQLAVQFLCARGLCGTALMALMAVMTPSAFNRYTTSPSLVTASSSSGPRAKKRRTLRGSAAQGICM